MIAPGSLARLVRLPNLPSAPANITMAVLAVCAQQPSFSQAFLSRLPAFLVLLVGSACLYLAGMVLNDYFDQDEDRRDRPERPIPSGEVSSGTALALGLGLLAVGVVLAALSASWVIAVALAVLIVVYNAYAKQTWLGPLAMGGCRFLHVLLGASLMGSGPFDVPAPGTHLALVVGLYVVGLTWFARDEAGLSDPRYLTAAAGLVLAALVLAIAVPAPLKENTASPLFPYLLVALGFFLGVPLWQAIQSPTPSRVQAGARRLLMGLILLDTVLATGAAGSVGLVVLVLMVPSLVLNRMRRLYAT